MSVYSRIFLATSRRLTSSVSTGYRPQVIWALPGFIGATWFLWGALSPDIQGSVGLYYDPDALLNKVEAERTQRLEAKEASKAGGGADGEKAGEDGEEEEEDAEEEDEEAVTHEDIAAAVSKAVEQSGGDDEDEEEDDEDAAPATAPGPAEEEETEDEKEDEEEEEEEEAPKKKKVKLADLTLEERYDHFAASATTPGEVSQFGFQFGAVYVV
jgi:hypothetical protein